MRTLGAGLEPAEQEPCQFENTSFLKTSLAKGRALHTMWNGMENFTFSLSDIPGMKVTIMGLGLHGGGLESARFFCDRGALVTVTDLRDETILKPSIEALGSRKIRYVLGRHEMDDFSSADIVIKNPAVRKDSPYLAAAKQIESDISVFLRFSKSPLIAVTGSKGKSSTASAVYFGLQFANIKALLGGNITVSPLSFIVETAPERPVVLELSSWQLADLRGKGVLKPKVSILTSIMPDHMNYYRSMEDYVADKRVIYAEQDEADFTICDFDSEWGRSFASETKATVLWYSGETPSYQKMRQQTMADTAKAAHSPASAFDNAFSRGAWLSADTDGKIHGYCRFENTLDSRTEEILPPILHVKGEHMRKNLLAAGLALKAIGLEPALVAKAMGEFPGVAHRLEFFAEARGIQWYNDSAATIPDAVAAAVSSFSEPVVLITGGTDKNIDFAPIQKAFKKAAAIVLLKGSGTDKMIPILKALGKPYQGPYDNLNDAIAAAEEHATPGTAVVLSPGCASFGMFLHEFDRGEKFKAAVRNYLNASAAYPTKDSEGMIS